MTYTIWMLTPRPIGTKLMKFTPLVVVEGLSPPEGAYGERMGIVESPNPDGAVEMAWRMTGDPRVAFLPTPCPRTRSPGP